MHGGIFHYALINGKERMLRSLTREPNLNDNRVAEICRRYLDDLVNVGCLRLDDLKEFYVTKEGVKND